MTLCRFLVRDVLQLISVPVVTVCHVFQFSMRSQCSRYTPCSTSSTLCTSSRACTQVNREARMRHGSSLASALVEGVTFKPGDVVQQIVRPGGAQPCVSTTFFESTVVGP